MAKIKVMDLIIGVTIGLIIIGYVGPTALQSFANSNIGTGQLTTASGVFTFSGNVTSGELANISISFNNGTTFVYRFEFNATNGSTCLTLNCISVNLTGSDGRYWNQSYYASGNLTAAINANTSTASIVTASNTTNKTTITAVSSGATGNNIALSDNTANLASSGLSGGQDSSLGKQALYAIFVTVLPILGALLFLFLIYLWIRHAGVG